MLSYQHIYHAGNLADVQKHALMCWILDYLTQKPKPISYLETHAGRGLYDLAAPEALKTGEAAAGIGSVEGALSKDHPYLRAIASVRAQYGDAAYGGSPLLAAHLLRPEDRIHLAELHPREGDALEDAMAMFPVKVHRKDGFEMAQAICPPTPRRGVALIDPSYEIKADYGFLPGFIAKLHRKWNVGVIALWYPILKDGPHKEMIRALEKADYPKALRHEVQFPPAKQGHRMVGSGMYFINAPWGLEAESARLDQLFQKG